MRQAPLANRRAPGALDLARFTLAAISLLAQRIGASASAEYRPQFGVGVTDWRVMAWLGAEPWIAPVRLAAAAGLDKAAVSRALRDLAAAKLVEADAPTGRRRRFALTEAGVTLHDRLAAAALARERRMLSGFSEAERAQLQDFLARLLRGVATA